MEIRRQSKGEFRENGRDSVRDPWRYCMCVGYGYEKKWEKGCINEYVWMEIEMICIGILYVEMEREVDRKCVGM